MLSNPGKKDYQGTVLINNEGTIVAVFAGHSHTMVRNRVVGQLMKLHKLSREEALNFFDDNFSTVENISVVGFSALVRKKKGGKRGRPKES